MHKHWLLCQFIHAHELELGSNQVRFEDIYQDLSFYCSAETKASYRWIIHCWTYVLATATSPAQYINWQCNICPCIISAKCDLNPVESLGVWQLGNCKHVLPLNR